MNFLMLRVLEYLNFLSLVLVVLWLTKYILTKNKMKTKKKKIIINICMPAGANMKSPLHHNIKC